MPREKVKTDYTNVPQADASPSEWLDAIIIRALEERASDIHIEPAQGKLIVRYRVDGVLRVVDQQPLDIHDTVIYRLKELSQLNIGESRRPQEGHASVADPQHPGQNIDMRVSIFPTVAGETADLRILNRQDVAFDDVASLGMSSEDTKRFLEVINRPSGLLLVTGPVGVGKTTTLYTAIKTLRSPERNIMTLEDPVEYQIDFVRQSQINPASGFTFSTGLKSILRQDPDIIMVGEIRDSETAEIVIRASLLGRLLFSTMHTSESVLAIVRLVELGIPRSLIASALHMVVAQRLIRKVCDACAEVYKPAFSVLSSAGILSDTNEHFRKGRGCKRCFGSGYWGRTGVFESLYFDDELKLMILEGASVADIRNSARLKGMTSLREEAVGKARIGITTLEEAVRATPG